MKVTPITEADAKKQASAFLVWPRGIYDFEVAMALDKLSKAENEMIELDLRVFNQDGKSRVVKDWLVSTDGTGYKVRHFAQSIGMLPQYVAGELKAHDVIGKTGKCQLRIKTGELKPDSTTERYPDKNAVADYLPPGSALPPVTAKPTDEIDDEIPF